MTCSQILFISEIAFITMDVNSQGSALAQRTYIHIVNIFTMLL